MAKNPPAPDVEALHEEQSELAARSAAVRRQLQQAALEEHRRQQEAQRAFDQQMVASFSRRELEEAVDAARRKLDATLEASPLVLAYADYVYAMHRRRQMVVEHVAALGRLGHEGGPPALPPTADGGPLDDHLTRAAQRLAEDRVAAEVADLHTRRLAATTDK